MIEVIDGKIYHRGFWVATIREEAKEARLADFIYDLEVRTDETSYNEGYEAGYEEGHEDGFNAAKWED